MNAGERAVDQSLPLFRDVVAGLSQPQKTIPGKYLWDAKGSAIFDKISEDASYYPTAPEMSLLRRCAGEIAEAVGPGVSIVEFGSGASHKVRVLLDAMDSPARYIAIDISADFLAAAAARVRHDYPKLEVLYLCGDYSGPLPRLPLERSDSVLGFFPGTTIGNMEPEASVLLLGRMREALGPSHLLIGQDSTEDEQRLLAAYGSSLMAEFHKNILERLRHELGARLAAGDFEHQARLVKEIGRVEAHLVAKQPTEITLGQHVFRFAAGESILTDQSRKYQPKQFRELLLKAGWTVARCWEDAEKGFNLFLARAAPERLAQRSRR